MRGKPPSVLFLITEDWFFVSHFLSLADAVRRAGFLVAVHLRVNDPALQARIEAAGVRVIPGEVRRHGVGLMGSLSQIVRLRALFRREAPDIVHAISLRMIVLGGVASAFTGFAKVHAMTGLGLLGAADDLRSRVLLRLVGLVLRYALGGRRSAFVFENEEDLARLDLAGHGGAVLVVGGAGIDPVAEGVLPMPLLPPLKIALVARMIHSKGVDVAARALTIARDRGADVTLTLVGAPDPGNPRTLTVADLNALAERPGLAWIGRTDDVRGIWRDHHVVCVPSRGGEGLPRSLLEGAAAGRAVVTTTTPGCAAFVRPGVEGLLVPPGDASALAQAFIDLADAPQILADMGAAARARVLQGYTIEAVSAAIITLYRGLLGRGSNRPI